MNRNLSYLPLVVLGALAPGYFTYRFSVDKLAELGGASLANLMLLSPAFYADAAQNWVASQLLADILLCTLVFFAWAWGEARRLGMRHFWVYPLLTYGVAFSLAMPLFMWARARRMETLKHG
ncbi:DUF2834 domain-containing protein [Noviherbaspirillum denitrificans]|uniref:DUF2834 domain-containing protein n=1 Tax=Noviherbaspirillum denitrificans TaxID=1968433 RepID=A0A254T5T4_9BURK|nr:DUF2834 domain-containing protein [Noviherbaspirillum denitrificans]OWW18041.1 hypothetical protein AYR66_03165 [Noviherbaspirillum denitrificans]